MSPSIYTPPGTVRVSSAPKSPSPPPAVIRTNVKELTTITERATTFVHQAKPSNKDILSLKAPAKICELEKDYCSEAITAEMHKTKQERPGPSCTKPNVKTKPTVKIYKALSSNFGKHW